MTLTIVNLQICGKMFLSLPLSLSLCLSLPISLLSFSLSLSLSLLEKIKPFRGEMTRYVEFALKLSSKKGRRLGSEQMNKYGKMLMVFKHQ